MTNAAAQLGTDGCGIEKFFPESFRADMTLAMQPLHDIRLHSAVQQ
jgi:hypothetical protein